MILESRSMNLGLSNAVSEVCVRYLVIQNLPYGVFWLRCSCHWKWYVFFAPFFAHFLRISSAFLSSKFLFFHWMGKSIGLFQKKIKQGHNYYPKFSISHFFQSFQHFFYLMNNRKKPFNVESETNRCAILTCC